MREIPVALFVVILLAGARGALAQACPPNSHARAVSIPGNLQTAHCWCDAGFQNIGGVCVLIKPAPPRTSPAAPLRPKADQ
jgi:hypothetical protein